MTENLDRKARSLALEDLRERRFRDLEQIYDAMFALATNPEAEDKDRVNGAKVAAQILGVSRPAQEKAPAGPTGPTSGPDSPAPKLDPAVEARIKQVIGK